MGYLIAWCTVCDQCGARGPLKRGTNGDAERRAVKAGWLAWEGRWQRFHACPDCKGQLSEDLGLAQSLADSNEVRGSVT